MVSRVNVSQRNVLLAVGVVSAVAGVGLLARKVLANSSQPIPKKVIDAKPITLFPEDTKVLAVRADFAELDAKVKALSNRIEIKEIEVEALWEQFEAASEVSEAFWDRLDAEYEAFSGKFTPQEQVFAENLEFFEEVCADLTHAKELVKRAGPGSKRWTADVWLEWLQKQDAEELDKMFGIPAGEWLGDLAAALAGNSPVADVIAPHIKHIVADLKKHVPASYTAGIEAINRLEQEHDLLRAAASQAYGRWDDAQQALNSLRGQLWELDLDARHLRRQI